MRSTYIKKAMLTAVALAALVVAGCASGPKVRSDAAANVNFSGFKTFAFMPEPATDNAGYATLITQHFKDAIDFVHGGKLGTIAQAKAWMSLLNVQADPTDRRFIGQRGLGQI